MQQTINIQEIPDIISLTDLRYRTRVFLRKLLEEEKPLILVKQSKKVAVIYPLVADVGAKRPEEALKIRPYPLQAPRKIKRAQLYNNYLEKKLR